VHASQYDWENMARFVVGAFRADVARAGAASAVSELVNELCHRSAEFEKLWREVPVHVPAHGEAVKHIKHPVLGTFAFEYSAFAVDGRPDLSLVIYNPATQTDLDKIIEAMKSAHAASTAE
jgi:hypothetical protein